MRILADNLRLARERLGFSQLQVEQVTGISHKTISNYENGVSSPGPENLLKFCTAYNISADMLLGRRATSAQAALSQDERYLVDVFRGLSPEGRTHLLQSAKGAALAFPNKLGDRDNQS